MPEGDIESYHASGSWRNRIEALEELEVSTRRRTTRFVSVVIRLATARSSIRNLDGTIAERNAYGHDPRNIPG